MKLFIFALFILFFALAPLEGEAACTVRRTNILRQGPSSSFKRIRVLPKYSPIEVIGEKGRFKEVKGRNFSGWIFSKSVTENYECIMSMQINSSFCRGKKSTIKRTVGYEEGFKTLKKEIGCNYVQDKFGKKFWISTINTWPSENSLLIKIK
ncbi:MAG: hypothetical protein ACJAT2_002466 [Bacteriovoracaceae bacterium]|jgi:hypothetical protein